MTMSTALSSYHYHYSSSPR